MPETPVGLQTSQRRDLVIEAEARTLQNMRKEARVTVVLPKGGPEATFHSDEGTYLGGESSAPPPLSYFCASVAFCELTQVSRYAKMLKIRIDEAKIRVTTRFRMEGSALAGTLHGYPLEFDYDLDIASPEPPERIRELTRLVHRSCFVTQALVRPTTVRARTQLNGDNLEAERVPPARAEESPSRR